MKVKFQRDIFNAGTKIYEAGREYSGDLARYVRRGEAVEVKGQETAPEPASDKGSKGKGKK